MLVDAGHDVATVAEQGLSGADDPLVFPPERYAGIAVLRPRRLIPEELLATVTTLILALERDSIEGKLWTVERHRIREYLPEEPPPGD